MAKKPLPDDKKTERLHMLISPSELDAIDDWRFAKRLPTRAEAVRRLVQIGKVADRNILTALLLSEEASDTLHDYHSQTVEFRNAKTEVYDDQSLWLLDEVLAILKDAFARAEATNQILNDMANQISEFDGERSIAHEIADAKKWKEIGQRERKTMKARHRRWRKPD